MTAATSPIRRPSMPLLFAIGAVANFFDTLGIGAFATTTTALKLGNMVEDENIPGTLNIGYMIPVILEAVLS